MNVAAGISGLAVLLAGAPAAAGEARDVLSVTAIVMPACSVDRNASAPHRADVACSTGAAVSTMTAAGTDERPLADAEALLGVPVRRGRAVVFTASPAAGAATDAGADQEQGARYLTITY